MPSSIRLLQVQDAPNSLWRTEREVVAGFAATWCVKVEAACLVCSPVCRSRYCHFVWFAQSCVNRWAQIKSDQAVIMCISAAASFQTESTAQRFCAPIQRNNAKTGTLPPSSGCKIWVRLEKYYFNILKDLVTISGFTSSCIHNLDICVCTSTKKQKNKTQNTKNRKQIDSSCKN